MVAGRVEKQGDGTFLAKLVVVIPPKGERMRGLGKVTDVGDDSITVERLGGETVTVYVDEETTFRISGVEDPGLEDIEMDDVVAGVVVKQEDDTLLAKRIAVVPPKDERVRGLGKVVEVGDDSLTVETRDGGTRTVYVDDETTFRIKSVEDPGLDDINVGDVVAGQAEKQEDDTLLAKLIIVVPPKGERPRGLGKVTAVEGDTITVERRGGDEMNILTDGETVFRVKGVENPTIADIQVGDVVAGVVEKGENGTLLAKLIAVVPPKRPVARGIGVVTAIGGNALTVETRGGDTVEVLTDGDTVFRMRDVENPTIVDIHVGDRVAGRVEKQGDGTLLAKVITVLPPQPQGEQGGPPPPDIQ
jgi:hypothetical protein